MTERVRADERANQRPLLRTALLLIGTVGLAAAWRWTPLGNWIDLQTIAGWEASFRGNPAAPLLVAAVYVAGSLVLVPVTLMTLATVVVFGLWPGYVYALSGCLLSGAVTYGIGRILGRNTVRRIAGSRVDAFNRSATRHGFVTVLIVRILPIAPFTIVNLVVGASGIRFQDFIGGTLLGMMPGLAGLVAFEYGLEHALRTPGTIAVAILAGLVASIAAGWVWVRRRLARNPTVAGYLPSMRKRHV